MENRKVNRTKTNRTIKRECSAKITNQKQIQNYIEPTMY